MSDNSATTIPWQTYEELSFSLSQDERPDPLSEEDVRHLCKMAIKDTGASVSERDLWLSVAIPYAQNTNRPTHTLEDHAGYLGGLPRVFDVGRLRTLVESLRDKRKSADGELSVD